MGRPTVLDRYRRRLGLLWRAVAWPVTIASFSTTGIRPSFSRPSPSEPRRLCVPIDARLTPFEIENLARAAAPRFSLWSGSPDAAGAAPPPPWG